METGEVISLNALEIGEERRSGPAGRPPEKEEKICGYRTVAGTPLRLEGKAPFGGLLRINVLGSSITLHSNDAEHILVEAQSGGIRDDEKEFQNRACGKSELRQNNHFQSADRNPAACGELSRRDGGTKGRRILSGRMPCGDCGSAGIYSLSSSSPEEKVAFRELMSPGIDLILNVVDSSIPQRSLYLTTQLTELGIPMLIVFNMMDEAREKGLEFQFRNIEKCFGAEIVQTVGVPGRRNGSSAGEHPKRSAFRTGSSSINAPLRNRRGRGNRRPLSKKSIHIPRTPAHTFPPAASPSSCWKTMRPSIRCRNSMRTAPRPDLQRGHLEEKHAIESETFMADCRYGIISGLCRTTVRSTPGKRQQLSDRIDKVVTSKFIGCRFSFSSCC